MKGAGGGGGCGGAVGALALVAQGEEAPPLRMRPLCLVCCE